MGLQEDFEAASKTAASGLPDTLSNDEKLEIYALYKQATVGDCNTAQPGLLDFTGKAKWNAWNAKKGQYASLDAAKQAYIDFVASMEAKHGKK